MSEPRPNRGRTANEDRLPPHAEEAERAVLGACLLSPEAMETALELVPADGSGFYDLRHHRVWLGLVALYGNGQPPDTVLLHQWLKEKGWLEELGGAAFLAELTNEGVPANVAHYAGVLREKWLLRKVVAAGAGMVAAGYDPQARAGAVLEAAEKSVLELSAARSGRAEVAARELVTEALTRYENYKRGVAQGNAVPTRYKYLDRLLGGGLHPGQLVIVAARPSQGKTSLLTMLAQQIAVDGKAPVGLFSLEMTRDELTDRILFQRARADYQRYRTGFLSLEDLAGVLAGPSQEVGNAPLWIDDTPGLNCMDIRARARRMARQYGLKVVMVDYLQLIGPSQRYDVREQEVAEVSRTMKALAKELGLPVVLAAQLNRETEKNRNRPPMLSDLRESGAIEQDADVVMALYRPEIGEEEERKLAALTPAGDWTGKLARVDLLVLKQRNGPSDKPDELVFRKSSMRFEEWNRNNGTTTGAPGMDLDGWELPKLVEEEPKKERDLPSVAELFGGETKTKTEQGK